MREKYIVKHGPGLRPSFEHVDESEIIILWSMLHDGYVENLIFDEHTRELTVSIAPGFPDSEEVGKEIRIEVEGVNHLICTQVKYIQNMYLDHSVGHTEYVAGLGEDDYGLIYSAEAVVNDLGVAARFSNLAFSGKSWKWYLDGVETQLEELLRLGEGQWDQWSERHKAKQKSISDSESPPIDDHPSLTAIVSRGGRFHLPKRNLDVDGRGLQSKGFDLVIKSRGTFDDERTGE